MTCSLCQESIVASLNRDTAKVERTPTPASSQCADLMH